MNKVILVGRLGNDPVRRETKSGLAVANFSVATSRLLGSGSSHEGKNDGRDEETEWHRIVVWAKQADSCRKYLHKGDLVYVEGMVRSRKYTAKDGTLRTAYEVHAEEVTFLERRRSVAATDLGEEVLEAANEVIAISA